jgi:serine/threonine protein kinase
MTIFDDLQIIKELGSGGCGSSYLVKKSNKEYVLKIQKILYSDKKFKDNIRDYKEMFWREVDLYEFITKIKDNNDKSFFSELYNYEIVNNCDYDYKPPFSTNSKFFQKLQKSKWCIKYLLEYKEGITLHDFLLKNTLTEKQIYSILLQLCKIILILYNAGYSHCDLHLGNIIINKTTKNYFDFMDKKIAFNGYQISVIDYGLVIHEKYGKYYYKALKGNGDTQIIYMFNEMFNVTYRIIDNNIKYVNDCTKAKKKLPWERKDYKVSSLIRNIMLKESDFYNTAKDKYLKMYPHAKKVLNYFEDNIETKEIYDLFNKKYYNDLSNIIHRIQYEFHVLFPKKYAKYGKWCSHYEYLLPNDVVLNLLKINNHNDFVNYLINKYFE